MDIVIEHLEFRKGEYKRNVENLENAIKETTNEMLEARKDWIKLTKNLQSIKDTIEQIDKAIALLKQQEE